MSQIGFFANTHNFPKDESSLEENWKQLEALQQRQRDNSHNPTPRRRANPFKPFTSNRVKSPEKKPVDNPSSPRSGKEAVNDTHTTDSPQIGVSSLTEEPKADDAHQVKSSASPSKGEKKRSNSSGSHRPIPTLASAARKHHQKQPRTASGFLNCLDIAAMMTAIRSLFSAIRGAVSGGVPAIVVSPVDLQLHLVAETSGHPDLRRGYRTPCTDLP